MSKWLGLGLVALLVLRGLGAVSSYNSLVRLDQAVSAQWGQVENVYQRRLDLVPNLIETVKGAARFEQQTLTQVTAARTKASQVTTTASKDILEDPAAFQQFQQAQQNLSGALSRLLVTVDGSLIPWGFSRSRHGAPWAHGSSSTSGTRAGR